MDPPLTRHFPYPLMVRSLNRSPLLTAARSDKRELVTCMQRTILVCIIVLVSSIRIVTLVLVFAVVTILLLLVWSLSYLLVGHAVFRGVCTHCCPRPAGRPCMVAQRYHFYILYVVGDMVKCAIEDALCRLHYIVVFPKSSSRLGWSCPLTYMVSSSIRR